MKPTPLPEPFASRPFRARDALDAHAATPRRLRADDLIAPFHGARSTTAPSTLADLAGAYAPLMRPVDYFSHSSAAALWGIPLPGRIERSRVVHVSVDAPAFPGQGAGVVGHRSFRARPVVERSGVRVLDPAHTWACLAPLLSEDELVIAGDHLVQRKRPLASLERMADAVERMRRTRGFTVAARALTHVRAGTDSPRETRMRLYIVASGLPEPVIRHRVVHQGEYIGVPDLAYPELRVAIEYEGLEHQQNRATYLSDIGRREAFARAGWTVVIVTKEDLDGAPDLWLRRIRFARDTALAR